MSQPPATEVKIEAVPPEDRPETLELMLSGVPVSERSEIVRITLLAEREGKASLEGLFRAVRRDVLVGAVWTSIAPGRTASVFSPELRSGEDESTADMLLAEVDRFLSDRGVRTVQSLLDDARSAGAVRLHRGGYVHEAELLYLVCLAEQCPETLPETRLVFEPYNEVHRKRMERLILQTYEGTLDCPRLNDICEIGDVLTGYRHTGDFSPDRWFFVRHLDQDVGCLLLTDHPDLNQWELVYMGLAAWARGRLWGLQVTRHAQWLTRCALRRRLVVGVDAANQPAVAMYATAGFTAWDRKCVFLKTFEP